MANLIEKVRNYHDRLVKTLEGQAKKAYLLTLQENPGRAGNVEKIREILENMLRPGDYEEIHSRLRERIVEEEVDPDDPIIEANRLAQEELYWPPARPGPYDPAGQKRWRERKRDG